jgi:hypothetical protein
MKSKTLYRSAALLLVFFAVGHTSGVLGSKNLPPEALSVRAAMFATHFTFMSSDQSFGGIFTGFGLLVTAYLLFSALLAWTLGGLSKENSKAASPVFWGLLATLLVNVVMAKLYFFAGPAILSAVIGICLGLAKWKESN